MADFGPCSFEDPRPVIIEESFIPVITGGGGGGAGGPAGGGAGGAGRGGGSRVGITPLSGGTIVTTPSQTFDRTLPSAIVTVSGKALEQLGLIASIKSIMVEESSGYFPIWKVESNLSPR